MDFSGLALGENVSEDSFDNLALLDDEEDKNDGKDDVQTAPRKGAK